MTTRVPSGWAVSSLGRAPRQSKTIPDQKYNRVPQTLGQKTRPGHPAGSGTSARYENIGTSSGSGTASTLVKWIVVTILLAAIGAGVGIAIWQGNRMNASKTTSVEPEGEPGTLVEFESFAGSLLGSFPGRH